VVGVLLVALAGGVAAALLYGGATRPGPAATASQQAGPATAVSPSSRKPTCQFTDQRPALTEGASGVAVQQAQCELNASLSPSRFPALDITGVFGPQTVQRVRALEACTGIPVNGIIGPDTWAELDRWSVAPGYAC
jgi:peptidoglycan hydrolase-like protein with peptidoglycan-binding domain